MILVQHSWSDRAQNVYDHEFRKDGLVYIDDGEASKLSNVIVQLGDVLLNITGDSIARCCLVPEWVLPARVNQHVAIIRPTECLNSVYLQKYLSHPRIKAYMLGHDAGGTRKALTKGNIESFLIPLPPLLEQKAIAHILCTLDDKIELNQQMNQKLEAIAQAIFKSWFIDFDPVRAKMEGRQPVGMDDATATLFPDSFEDSQPGKIPKGWEVKPLDRVANFLNGLALQKYPSNSNEYLPVIKIAELRRGITESS
ncbi:MAG: restriction endonuclease subunit S, partial [Chroococcidiopsidaceae cyanobacterium CP_BM_RX_35]|nr:restriction endonuclease subunit S [Chroococcidiopsidaceae cyanobacterium CP_BM_RX_35]